MLKIPTNSWHDILTKELSKRSSQQLISFLQTEYQNQRIYPQAEKIFEAFNWTPYEQVKVVILGQDPYHGENQAHGLSFSVLPGNPIPPSLRNIYKELEGDLGIKPVTHGYLENWAKQGVLLLNTVLTVRDAQANSHRNQGWEELTDGVIQQLSQRESSIVFILWGKPAQEKGKMIDTSRHTILVGPHPSPLSAYRGFFGTNPFSKVNQILVEKGQSPINWQLPETV